ncbi:universal stress protein [Nocardioides alcanivorans]|uniref:universal stress protein n=1 Tax=Nocardioides alcanivorans TaxID=2897352 RepID=UPI001F44B9EC|nr:universal stress protein [Nocardioides alcanivorans]
MTKTIVCGVDGSETAASAARTAAELALGLGAHLHLVSAFGKLKAETIEIGSDRMLLSNEQEAESTARQVEIDLRRDFPALDVSSGPAEGQPGEALVNVATTRDASIIVVGNKRVQGIARVLGSVARDVVTQAPCDVYVAHTHA